MNRKLVVALALALAACGGTNKNAADPEFAEATPEIDAFMASVTGASSEQALTSEDLGQQESALMSESAYLLAVRDAVLGLNGIVRSVLTPIVEIIKDNPDVSTGTEHVWGPADRGGATYKFTMKKVTDKKFGWKLEGKVKGAADTEYKLLLAGGIRVGAQPHRGAGILGIDGDAFAAVDPAAFKSKGKLLVGFGHGANNAKALAYGLKEFTPNADKYQTVSARLLAIRGPAGGTVVRFATYADISDPKNGSPELVLARVRWLPLLGGRADGLVFNGKTPAATGDLALNTYLIVNSCWNVQEQQGYQKIRSCTAKTACTGADLLNTKEEGDAATCKVPEPATLPPEDPNAAQTDPDAATEGFDALPEPPAAVPDGTGSGL